MPIPGRVHSGRKGELHLHDRVVCARYVGLIVILRSRSSCQSLNGCIGPERGDTAARPEKVEVEVQWVELRLLGQPAPSVGDIQVAASHRHRPGSTARILPSAKELFHD